MKLSTRTALLWLCGASIGWMFIAFLYCADRWGSDLRAFGPSQPDIFDWPPPSPSMVDPPCGSSDLKEQMHWVGVNTHPFDEQRFVTSVLERPEELEQARAKADLRKIGPYQATLDRLTDTAWSANWLARLSAICRLESKTGIPARGVVKYFDELSLASAAPGFSAADFVARARVTYRSEQLTEAAQSDSDARANFAGHLIPIVLLPLIGLFSGAGAVALSRQWNLHRFWREALAVAGGALLVYGFAQPHDYDDSRAWLMAIGAAALISGLLAIRAKPR